MVNQPNSAFSYLKDSSKLRLSRPMTKLVGKGAESLGKRGGGGRKRERQIWRTKGEMMRRLSRRVRSHPPNAPHAIYDPLIPLTLYLSPPSMRLLSHNTSSPAARHTASSRNPAAIPPHPITTPKRRILSSPPPPPPPTPSTPHSYHVARPPRLPSPSRHRLSPPCLHPATPCLSAPPLLPIAAPSLDPIHDAQ